VAFRGQGAEVVLPLTGSIELARRCLMVLPSGGRTPLCEGLRAGREVLERERLRRPDMLGVMMVISDGKANVAPGGDPEAESILEARAIAAASIPLVFLDTDTTWEDPGLGMKLSAVAGGTYLGVGELSASAILDAIEAHVPRP
jgi:magnesium chelatase subunit D